MNLNLSDREKGNKENMKKTRGTTLPIHLTASRPSYRRSSRSFEWLRRSWENGSLCGIHPITFQEASEPYSPLKSHMWTAKNSGDGNIPGSSPAVNQTHNQQRHALEFQPEFLEPAQESKKTPSREGGSPDPALPDWLQTAKAALSPAGRRPKPGNRLPTPKATSPWKLWKRSSEFIGVLKAADLASVHNRTKSKHFCFPPPPAPPSLSPHPTASFQLGRLLKWKHFAWDSKNPETTITSDFRPGLVWSD